MVGTLQDNSPMSASPRMDPLSHNLIRLLSTPNLHVSMIQIIISFATNTPSPKHHFISLLRRQSRSIQHVNEKANRDRIATFLLASRSALANPAEGMAGMRDSTAAVAPVYCPGPGKSTA